MLGLERSLGTRLVTYADDLVILCKKGKADEALQQLRRIMSKLKLTLNEEKTRICKVPEESSTFWATRSDRCILREPARRAWDIGHQKSIKRMVEKIHALTDRTGTSQETAKLVGKLNRTLRGWANYFEVGTVTKAYRVIDSYTAVRLRRVRHQAQGQTTQGRNLSTLAPLRALRARYAWAGLGTTRRGRRREVLSESRMRGICMSGSMSGMWKRSHGRTIEAPPDERGGNRYVGPTATASHPDSTM